MSPQEFTAPGMSPQGANLPGRPPGIVAPSVSPPQGISQGVIELGTSPPLSASGISPQETTEPGMSQQAVTAPRMSPQVVVEPDMSPQAVTAPAMPPQVVVKPGMSPQGVVEPGVSPPGIAGPGLPPEVAAASKMSMQGTTSEQCVFQQMSNVKGKPQHSPIVRLSVVPDNLTPSHNNFGATEPLSSFPGQKGDLPYTVQGPSLAQPFNTSAHFQSPPVGQACPNPSPGGHARLPFDPSDERFRPGKHFS